ncbi:MAG: hypothetical protein WD025_08005 [Bacteriovoracaceae bacterium]
MSAIIFQTQSVLIVALMLYGVSRVMGKIKNRYQHIRIMKIAMIWDVLLILQIELSRGAIAKASKAVENPMMLNIHVSLAIVTVLLYIFIYGSGKKLNQGNKNLRYAHAALGYCALTTRMATLITSFLVL